MPIARHVLHFLSTKGTCGTSNHPTALKSTAVAWTSETLADGSTPVGQFPSSAEAQLLARAIGTLLSLAAGTDAEVSPWPIRPRDI